MSKAGAVFENPVTGERGVARIGTDETGGELLVADLYIRPGGAVMGEHLHGAHRRLHQTGSAVIISRPPCPLTTKIPRRQLATCE
jgi:hypothetical protein